MLIIQMDALLMYH